MGAMMASGIASRSFPPSIVLRVNTIRPAVRKNPSVSIAKI